MTEKEIYKNGVALLEEWEDVNYCEHTFKFKDEWLTDKEVVDLLSQLNDENEQLIREKERYKTLHRIACEQIDNRILTIKNFVEECSDDNVKKALKKLLCTEVQAYDVSAKNSALIDENEKLKKIKNQYMGQKGYLLFVIERACSKELFDTVKSHLINVEDLE